MADSNRVQWVYSSKDNQELEHRYDEWAKDYDSDLERDFEWHGPRIACDIFAKHVTSDARVLDVGAGTGLAGQELGKRGFSLIDGFDLSDGMLEVARATPWYNKLQKGVLGERLNYKDDSYDAAIATGVFTSGHAPASGFDEIVRIVRPGGYFVITLRPDIHESGGFKAKEEELAAAGKLKLIEATKPIAMLPKGEPDVRHQVRVYQVL